MSDTDLLKYFCKAAGHEPCPNWEIHRFELDKIDFFVHMLIDRIPDSIATGKAVQQASKSGQTSLTETVPPPPRQVIDHRDPLLEPKSVLWARAEDGGWVTIDPHVNTDVCYFREDCRKESILAYKPRRVKIFFDLEPDEWNEWR